MIELRRDPRSIIYSFCDGPSLGRLERVCKTFKTEINQTAAWKKVFFQDFGYEIPPNTKDCKSFYVCKYLLTQNIKSGNFGKYTQLESFTAFTNESFLCGDKLYVFDFNSVPHVFDLTTGKGTLLDCVGEFSIIKKASDNLFVLSDPGKFVLWDAANNRCLFHRTKVLLNTFYADEKQVICNIRGSLEIWDYRSQKMIKRMRGRNRSENIRCIKSLVLGNNFSVLYDNGILDVYDIVRGEKIYSKKILNPYNLLASGKDLIVLVEYDNPVAYIMELSTGKCKHRIGLLNNECSHTSTQLIGIPSTDHNTLTFWNIESSHIEASLTLPHPIFRFVIYNEMAVILTFDGLQVNITFWSPKIESSKTVSLPYSNPKFNFHVNNYILYLSFDCKIHFFNIVKAEKMGEIRINWLTPIAQQQSSPKWLIVPENSGVRAYNLCHIPSPTLTSRVRSYVMSMWNYLVGK